MTIDDDDIYLAYREREKQLENGSRPDEMIDPWDDRMEKWRRPDDMLNYRHERITK